MGNQDLPFYLSFAKPAGCLVLVFVPFFFGCLLFKPTPSFFCRGNRRTPLFSWGVTQPKAQPSHLYAATQWERARARCGPSARWLGALVPCFRGFWRVELVPCWTSRRKFGAWGVLWSGFPHIPEICESLGRGFPEEETGKTTGQKENRMGKQEGGCFGDRDFFHRR